MKTFAVSYARSIHGKLKSGTSYIGSESTFIDIEAENKGEALKKFLANPPKDFIKVNKIVLIKES